MHVPTALIDLLHGTSYKLPGSDTRRVTGVLDHRPIGLAMMYFRLLAVVRSIKSTVSDVHSVWLYPSD